MIDLKIHSLPHNYEKILSTLQMPAVICGSIICAKHLIIVLGKNECLTRGILTLPSVWRNSWLWWEVKDQVWGHCSYPSKRMVLNRDQKKKKKLGRFGIHFGGRIDRTHWGVECGEWGKGRWRWEGDNPGYCQEPFSVWR